MVRALAGFAGHELWLGDAGKIRAMEVRKQKTDRRDAQLLLQLLLEDRFPRVWVPSGSSAMCGSCCCIVTSWWGCGGR